MYSGLRSNVPASRAGAEDLPRADADRGAIDGVAIGTRAPRRRSRPSAWLRRSRPSPIFTVGLLPPPVEQALSSTSSDAPRATQRVFRIGSIPPSRAGSSADVQVADYSRATGFMPYTGYAVAGPARRRWASDRPPSARSASRATRTTPAKRRPSSRWATPSTDEPAERPEAVDRAERRGRDDLDPRPSECRR